eukprot:TRINITY_DN16711_c0_g1_i1.p1 TRINITY_DN16711_c0_g1~~TRINITY_DN16711_c0_g1_i1.p1  ORF type:complete len:241 (+),score=21.64 TRINITY_DN16711_c0_g1_i1:52-723(+)
MLRRTGRRLHWFLDQWNQEQTENLHLKQPEISETYTRISQGLERITPSTPDSELDEIELALKRAVLPISDALPVPRSIDPYYLTVNGEDIPQTFKFLPNKELYEHLVNSQMQWKLHPFESLISPHASGYMEPLGPIKGNEDLPYAIHRTEIGKLPLQIKMRRNYSRVSVQILNVTGDKEAFAYDIRRLLPNKRIVIRRDRVEIMKASYDVARVMQHYIFSIGY